ncbi:hypothetical protein DNC80_15270 [Flavobacterium sp. SOK18b]|nr:hypothetical protein [Flavobacterium sp. SOK18b]
MVWIWVISTSGVSSKLLVLRNLTEIEAEVMVIPSANFNYSLTTLKRCFLQKKGLDFESRPFALF